ncbi:MAG: ferritin-like domain-containing protein [Gemmatimonadaceae bacterium]
MTTDAGLLATIDPEIMTSVEARAAEIVRGEPVSSRLVAMLALGSIPIALGALAKDVYGQAPADVLDVLQFALLLEYLESDFYAQGLAATTLIPPTDRIVFTTIGSHESAHVIALQGLIQGKGATLRTKPAFDYTAKGNVPGFAFLPAQYPTFTMLAQAFEDLGVRAYKGQVGRLINDKRVLTQALAIHSVEARHACEVRRLRGKKGWITLDSRDDLPAFTQPIYDGEANTAHGAVNVSSFAEGFGGDTGASQAFDEPLTMAQVTAIITPFLA